MCDVHVYAVKIRRMKTYVVPLVVLQDRERCHGLNANQVDLTVLREEDGA